MKTGAAVSSPRWPPPAPGVLGHTLHSGFPLTSLTVPSASLLNLLHCPNFSPRRFAAFTLPSLYLVICVPNSVVSAIICMLVTSNL